MKKQVRAIVSGEVQGVGYRYKVFHVAARHNLEGYVRNLPDGNVEVVAEGEEDELKRFLEAINVRDGFVRVAEVKASFSSTTNEFEGFTIRR